MDIGRRINDMGTSSALLGAWVVVASGLSIVLNAAGAFDGDGPAISRVVLGLFGLVGGGIFWSGHNFGKTGLMLIIAWGVLQIPYIALEPDGNLTKQLFDGFLGATSQTTINGEITEYSKIGINLIGVAVVIWAATRRERLDLWRRRSGAAA